MVNRPPPVELVTYKVPTAMYTIEVPELPNTKSEAPLALPVKPEKIFVPKASVRLRVLLAPAPTTKVPTFKKLFVSGTINVPASVKVAESEAPGGPLVGLQALGSLKAAPVVLVQV